LKAFQSNAFKDVSLLLQALTSCNIS